MLGSNGVSIAPSILAADFGCLGAEIRDVEAAGADVIHVDVMDGHFVPNLSLGPPVVAAVRSASALPYDVHLMLTDPGRYVDAFAAAGADHITIHIESDSDIAATLARIHSHGCSAGLSLRPATPASALFRYLDQVELILVMSVEPGFGGQAFMAAMLPKMRQIRDRVERLAHAIHLEVDGGITADTAPLAIAAGANLLVAGSSVFGAAQGMAAAITALRGRAR